MREKAKIVYSTENTNNFPILESKDVISKFRDLEISGMSFISKRSKSIKPYYKKQIKQHGRTIIMKPENFKNKGFEIFKEIYNKPGTTKELAERMKTNLGAMQFQLSLLKREFPSNILLVKKSGNSLFYSLNKNESTSAEALYTKYRTPYNRPRYKKEKLTPVKEIKETAVSPTIKQLSDLLDKLKSLEHMVIDVNVTFNIKFGG